MGRGRSSPWRGSGEGVTILSLKFRSKAPHPIPLPNREREPALSPARESDSPRLVLGIKKPRPSMTSQSATSIDQTLARYRRMFDLGGKIALVLGAASGIGKASAEALAALGAVVICADIDPAGVEATAAGIGGKAHRV